MKYFISLELKRKLTSFFDPLPNNWIGFEPNNSEIYFDSSMENNFRSQLLNMNRRLGTTIILTAPGDRYLRKLEAMMIVADKEVSLLLSGTGDVIESDDGILAIGSGGPYANSAAKALIKNTNLNAKEIAIESLNIAADICIYTNHNIISETIEL